MGKREKERKKERNGHTHLIGRHVASGFALDDRPDQVLTLRVREYAAVSAGAQRRSHEVRPVRVGVALCLAEERDHRAPRGLVQRLHALVQLVLLGFVFQALRWRTKVATKGSHVKPPEWTHPRTGRDQIWRGRSVSRRWAR
eukprot:COSAG01_NODE_5221_length_4404_cov_2.044599_3_plen_142_part_00